MDIQILRTYGGKTSGTSVTTTGWYFNTDTKQVSTVNSFYEVGDGEVPENYSLATNYEFYWECLPGTYTRRGYFHDGSGGYTTQDQENATACGYSTEPEVLTLSVESLQNVSVFGASDGSVTLAATGGENPRQYRVEPDGVWQTSNKITGLAVGTYTFTMMDAMGFTATTTATITQPGDTGGGPGTVIVSKPVPEFPPKPTPERTDLLPYFDWATMRMVRATVAEWIEWLKVELGFAEKVHRHIITDVDNLPEVLSGHNRSIVDLRLELEKVKSGGTGDGSGWDASFDGFRPIKRIPTVGLVLGTANVKDTLNTLFWPFTQATVSMNPIPLQEKNRLVTITVSGSVNMGDETELTGRQLYRDGEEWGTWVGNSYSRQDTISTDTGYEAEIQRTNIDQGVEHSAYRLAEFIYPYFFGASDNQVIPGTLIYDSNKTLAKVGSTLVINSFGSGVRFPWFAVPKGTKVFTSWNRSALDNGAIGGSSNLFGNKISVMVSSTGIVDAEGNANNWTQEYDLYMANYKTDPNIRTTLS